MQRLILLLLIGLVSCSSPIKKKNTEEILPGDWLVLYADHKLTNRKQREIYGRYQDSILNGKGLKLLSLIKDKSFQQLDELELRGKWAVENNQLLINNGGAGFEHFKTDLTDFKNDTLQITEHVQLEGESIRLVWNLKKVDAPGLFSTKNNAWRKKPTAPEKVEEIEHRVIEMLQYYSRYYKLVAKESIYFIRNRVALPFNYYQHAMSLKPFDAQSDFSKLFYDASQAQMAHALLQMATVLAESDYPGGTNFVDEYAEFMKILAVKVVIANQPVKK